MKNISILGSTGSIGRNALEIVRRNKDLNVVSISANKNIDLLKEQVLEFSPKLVCIYDEESYLKFKDGIKGTELDGRFKLVSGMDGLIEAATVKETDIVLTAVVGMVGIRPTVAAIEAKKDIALANKETLVCAGKLIIDLCLTHGVHIYPVDSEHSAIFQSLNGENRGEAEKIILTCSGGPFRGKSLKELENVSVSDALNHPNWKMGKKITIDSATLANKGLEVMEACWLFNMPPEKIEVTVHPESILHSAVQFRDGAIIGQLGTPDMKIPIQYAFYYPERRYLEGKRVDLFELKSLTFERPDMDTFKALGLAYKALEMGGTMPCVFNAANEYAVKHFLNGEIKFTEIADIIERKMKEHRLIKNPSLDDIIRVGEEIINELC